MSIDTHMPSGHWDFDPEVTAVFDDMLQRSIPQYTTMRNMVFDLACRFQKNDTAIVDMGASRGEAIAQLIDRFGMHNRFVAVDVSDPMLEAMRTRWEGLINCGVVEVQHLDLRDTFPPVAASVVLCVLTLQFTPIEYRQQILQRVYDHLIPGGAFILVEKVLGNSAALDNLMVDTYYQLKGENGYTQEQIQTKRKSLEGVLVPVTARWNEELLRTAGFTQVDCFWRWMNFAGWIGIK